MKSFYKNLIKGNISFVKPTRPLFSFVSYKNFHKLSNNLQIYVNEEEALNLNEHDHIILQLQSNVIPEDKLPETMNQLIDLCNHLNKFADCERGCKEIVNYILKNKKKISKEDLEMFIKKIYFCLYKDDNFWLSVSEEICEREYSLMTFLELAQIITSSIKNSHSKMVSKLKNSLKEDLSSLETILLVKIFQNLGIDFNENSYRSIVSNLTNMIRKENLFTLNSLYMFKLMNIIQDLKEKNIIDANSELIQELVEPFERDYEKFNPSLLAIIIFDYFKIKQTSEEKTAQLLIDVSKVIKLNARTIRYYHYFYLIKLLSSNDQLIDILVSNDFDSPLMKFATKIKALRSDEDIREFILDNNKSFNLYKIDVRQLNIIGWNYIDGLEETNESLGIK